MDDTSNLLQLVEGEVCNFCFTAGKPLKADPTGRCEDRFAYIGRVQDRIRELGL